MKKINSKKENFFKGKKKRESYKNSTYMYANLDIQSKSYQI